MKIAKWKVNKILRNKNISIEKLTEKFYDLWYIYIIQHKIKMDNKLQLIKLEEISLKPNLFCLITSKRGTGKTVFSKSLIFELC